MRRTTVQLAAALLATAALVAAVEASLTFENEGGPPDLIGLWQGTDASGPILAFATDKGFVVTRMDTSGWLYTYQANFTSYNCTGEGEFVVLIERTTAWANGTTATEQMCEIGKVDIEEGWWAWSVSPVPDCPTSLTQPDLLHGNYTMLDSSLGAPGSRDLHCV